MLKNRNMEDIICIDKNVLPYLNHISNFVPVVPFKIDNIRAKKRRQSRLRKKKAALKKREIEKVNLLFIVISLLWRTEPVFKYIIAFY